MLSRRVIPTLLLKNTGLVKTINFKNPTYIGDPINAVKIFNDKEVDEIIFLDISKTKENAEPNYALIESIANECFIPFAYGGGLHSIEAIKKTLKIGAEKVVLNTAAFYNPNLIRESSSIFGSQSIVVSIDYKKNWLGKNYVFVESGKKNTKMSPLDYALKMEEFGAGELYLNSIDREGLRVGYDIDLLSEISERVKIPVIASGGANDLKDIEILFNSSKVTAAAAGSMFVYYGRKNGVLINYPKRADLIDLLYTDS
jgi:imidazole glycerol-phosphate synthase subunit HisF